MRAFALFTLLVVGTACRAASSTAPTSPASPSRAGRFDVTVSAAGVTIGGTMFRPDIEPGTVRPAIVVVHWSLPAGVSGAATFEPLARRFSENGYIALAISLRGWPPSGGTDDCGLRQPDDVVQVIKWLRGEPGVDAGHIGVIGFSLGGQIVLLTAARDAGVQAVVAFYPVTDIARRKVTTTDSDIASYITRICESGPGVTPRSPLAQAGLIRSPVLLVHGDADTRVPVEQSQLMGGALLSFGRDVELVVVPGAGHGFTLSAPGVAPVVDAFLASRLAWR